MNRECQRFVTWLVRSADGSLDSRSETELAGHLESCVACRAALDEQFAAVRLLDAVEMAPVCDEFAFRVRQQIERHSWIAELTNWKPWALRLAPAAVILALGATYLAMARQHPLPQEPAAPAAHAAPVAPAERESAVPVVPQPKRAARTAGTKALAERAGRTGVPPIDTAGKADDEQRTMDLAEPPMAAERWAVRPPRPFTPESPAQMVDRVTEDLDLTPAQRTRLQGLIERRTEPVDRFRAETDPNYQALRNEIDSEIDAILTPGQRHKLEERRRQEQQLRSTPFPGRTRTP